MWFASRMEKINSTTLTSWPVYQRDGHFIHRTCTHSGWRRITLSSLSSLWAFRWWNRWRLRYCRDRWPPCSNGSRMNTLWSMLYAAAVAGASSHSKRPHFSFCTSSMHTKRAIISLWIFAVIVIRPCSIACTSMQWKICSTSRTTRVCSRVDRCVSCCQSMCRAVTHLTIHRWQRRGIAASGSNFWQKLWMGRSRIKTWKISIEHSTTKRR